MANFDFQQTAQELQEFVNRTPAEIAELRALYESLTQTGVTPVAAADWPVSDPQENVIYRVAGTSSYTDYMWNGTDFIPMATYDNVPTDIPAVGSTDVITAGGVANHGSAFDISEYNKNGATLATYADLAAALGTNGANIPSDVRKGGMSVKFIQSSDNKYVQYRYMGTAVTGTPNPFLNTANWQGVDDVPVDGSDNLVKSGGVFMDIARTITINIDANSTSNPNNKAQSAYVFVVGSSPELASINSYRCTVIDGMIIGDVINIKGRSGSTYKGVALVENGKVVSIPIGAGEIYDYTVTYDGTFDSIYANSYNTEFTVSIQRTVRVKEDIAKLKDDVENLQDDVKSMQEIIGNKSEYETEFDLKNSLGFGYYVTTVGEPISYVSSYRKCLLITDLSNCSAFHVSGYAGRTGRLYGKIKNNLIIEVGSGVEYGEYDIDVDGSFDSIVFNVNPEHDYELFATKFNNVPNVLNSLRNDIVELQKEGYFYNKNAIIIGDSSVAGSSWAQRMFTELKFKNYHVFASGGRTIKNRFSGEELDNCLQKGIEDAIDYIDTNWEGKVDLIMMQIGGNDIGNITGTLEAAFSDTNYLSYQNDLTTWGSARYCYELIKRKYPSALVTVGTVFGRLGSNWNGNAETINELIREMAWRFNLQIIEGNRYCGFAPILEPISPYYNDMNPGTADDRSELSRENPAYNYIDSSGNIVTYAEATESGELKPGYTKRYGLYTYDGKHQNLNGENKVLTFMKAEILKLL